MKNFSIEPKKAFLVKDRYSRKRLSGIDVEKGYLLYGVESVYFTDARYFSQAKKKIESVGLRAELFTSLMDIKKVLKEQNIKCLFIDFEKVTVSEYNLFKKLKVKLKDGSLFIKKTRAIKTESELESIKKACAITEKAYYATLKSVKAGITEKQLADVLWKNMEKHGAESFSFEPIVAFGKNTAVPHHETGDTVLESGMPILIDCGCTINGYCSDFTRTCVFKKASDEFIKNYNAVREANQLAQIEITSGMTGSQADSIAREYLENKGLAEYFTHSLGHGIGLQIHEFPTLRQGVEDLLVDGMVFSIEPGVYFENKYGIRIEDTVVLVNGKVERLFKDKKELKII